MLKKINSNENTFFKNLKKLYQNKSERKKLEQTILDGPHLIKTFMESGGEVRDFIKDTSINHDEINQIFDKYPSINIAELSHELFCEISELKSSTGLMALINIPEKKIYKKEAGLHLLIDNVQEPGNLGSILRSHAAFANRLVFLSKGCCELWSPKTLRGSQGIQFFLTCYEDQDLLNLIDTFNFPTYSICKEGPSLYDHKFQNDVAVIFGNEGQGVGFKLMQKVEKNLSIPMAEKVDSLNVGSAASIVMYEYARQLQARVT